MLSYISLCDYKSKAISIIYLPHRSIYIQLQLFLNRVVIRSEQLEHNYVPQAN